MKISFIIPIYNGEKYLNKCIDSILNQTITGVDFEIICIDDCSIDNSKGIIKNYQRVNSNIKLIENPQNFKTGTVCNIGLDNALGEFVWFIGQDDWIRQDSLTSLESIITLSNPDVIAFNYRRVDFLEKELHSAEVFNNSNLVAGADYIRSKFGDAFPHYLLGYEWRAIFNRDYLKKQKIRFPDGGIYEDTTFLFKAILYTEKFTSISDFLYYYRVNTNSITDINKKFKGDLVFEFAFKVGNEVLDLANEIKDTYPDFSKQLFIMAKWYFNGFAPKIIGATTNEKINFYNEISKNKILVKTAGSYLKPISYILTLKTLGIISAIMLKPAFRFKKKVIDRKKNVQEWCY